MREGTTRDKRDPLCPRVVLGRGHGDRIEARLWSANFSLWLLSPSHVRWDPGRPGELAGRRVPYQRHEGSSPSGTK